jgi:hypothetical protein
MNPTRPVPVLALALALPLVLSACGNKGPLVRATPVPATIDGTPTIDAPVEGEADEDSSVGDTGVEAPAVEDTDPSDEITLPDEDVSAEGDVAPAEDEPTPEPAPDPVPPAETPNG